LFLWAAAVSGRSSGSGGDIITSAPAAQILGEGFLEEEE
jgi:hypothetical protein